MKKLFFFLAVFVSAASYGQQTEMNTSSGSGLVKKSIRISRLSGNSDASNAKVSANPVTDEVTIRLTKIPETETTIIVATAIGSIIQQFKMETQTVTFRPDWPDDDICAITISSDDATIAGTFVLEKNSTAP